MTGPAGSVSLSARPVRIWRWVFVAAVVTNVAALYWPRGVSTAVEIPQLDKVVHLLLFAAVAWTGLRARLQGRVLLPLLVVHAVLSEVLQATLLPQRSGDPADVLADLAGVLAGILLARASWGGEHAEPA